MYYTVPVAAGTGMLSKQTNIFSFKMTKWETLCLEYILSTNRTPIIVMGKLENRGQSWNISRIWQCSFSQIVSSCCHFQLHQRLSSSSAAKRSATPQTLSSDTLHMTCLSTIYLKNGEIRRFKPTFRSCQARMPSSVYPPTKVIWNTAPSTFGFVSKPFDKEGNILKNTLRPKWRIEGRKNKDYTLKCRSRIGGSG